MNYIQTNYQQHQWLPLQVVQEAIDGNYLDSLIYFLWCRELYSNRIIYNYNCRRLSALIGCSPATVAHHINILLSKGLCHRSSQHLVFKSNKQFTKEKLMFVAVGISQEKATQRAFLRFVAFKKVLLPQKRVFTQKNTVILFRNGNLKPGQITRKVIKADKMLPDNLESSLCDQFTLSNRKIGTLANRSQSTGLKIQKAFNHIGLIKSLKRIKLIDNNKRNLRSFYSACLDSSHFLSHSGFIYKRQPNALVLNSNT